MDKAISVQPERQKLSHYQRNRIAKALQVVGALDVELYDLPDICEEYAGHLKWAADQASDTAKTIARMIKSR